MTQIQPMNTPYNQIAAIIEAAPLADSTKEKYTTAVLNFLEAGGNLTDRDQLRAYTASLSNSARSHLKAAIKIWSDGIADEAMGSATAENLSTVTAILYRFQALNNTIKVKAAKGQKAHIWLSQAEVKKLLATCNDGSLICQRNKIVLGLLTGAGLRRAELAALTWGAVKFQPIGRAAVSPGLLLASNVYGASFCTLGIPM